MRHLSWLASAGLGYGYAFDLSYVEVLDYSADGVFRDGGGLFGEFDPDGQVDGRERVGGEKPVGDGGVLAGVVFQDGGLPGPVGGVAEVPAAQVEEVEADGGAGVAGAGGELPPELGSFLDPGEDEEAGEGECAAGVAGGVEAGDAPGGVGVVDDALAQGAEVACRLVVEGGRGARPGQHGGAEFVESFGDPAPGFREVAWGVVAIEDPRAGEGFVDAARFAAHGSVTPHR
jgi:hypothetical protein